MKKSILIITAVLIPFSLAAISLSIKGDTSAMTSFDAGICYRPFDFDFLNPELRIDTGVSYSAEGFSFDGVYAGIELELFRTMKNPLRFTLVNPGPWSPSVLFGVHYLDNSVALHTEISLFRTLDKDFIYEWFVVGCDFARTEIENWSVAFLRVTGLS